MLARFPPISWRYSEWCRSDRESLHIPGHLPAAGCARFHRKAGCRSSPFPPILPDPAKDPPCPQWPRPAGRRFEQSRRKASFRPLRPKWRALPRKGCSFSRFPSSRCGRDKAALHPLLPAPLRPGTGRIRPWPSAGAVPRFPAAARFPAPELQTGASFRPACP